MRFSLIKISGFDFRSFIKLFFKKIRDEAKAQAESAKALEDSAVECQRQEKLLNDELKQLKIAHEELSAKTQSFDHDESELREQFKIKENALKADVEDNKLKYHQNYEELSELKDALNHMGVEVSGSYCIIGSLSFFERSFFRLTQNFCNAPLLGY